MPIIAKEEPSSCMTFSDHVSLVLIFLEITPQSVFMPHKLTFMNNIGQLFYRMSPSVSFSVFS